MDIFNRKKKQKDAPLIARVDLSEVKKEMRQDLSNRDKSILAEDFSTPRFRVFYACFEEEQEFIKSRGLKLNQTFQITAPRYVPLGMSIEDAYKIVSYLIDKTQKENNDLCFEKCFRIVMSKLSDYGFKEDKFNVRQGYLYSSAEKPFGKIKTAEYFDKCKKVDGVTDLFVIDGDVNLFKNSDLNDRYFNWYKKDITTDKVYKIYQDIGREDLFLTASNNNKEKEL